MTTGNVPDSVAKCMQAKPEPIPGNDGEVCLGASFVFGPDFPGFDGHFPGNPIVPGIVQIMAAAQVASFALPGTLTGVKRCKFLRPVKPGERIDLAVSCSQNGQCTASLTVEGAECASVQFSLGA